MFKSIASYNRGSSVNPDAVDNGNVDPDFVQLRRLASSFLKRANSAAALVCLDHVFSRTPNLHKATLKETEDLLSLYLAYVRLLDQFWRDGQLSEGSDRQKVLAFEGSDRQKVPAFKGSDRQKVLALEVQQEDYYLVPKNTFIHVEISAKRGIFNDPPPEYICSREELGRITSEAILRRIKSRVETQERACRGTRGFSPCLLTLIGRKCSNEQCQFQHTKPDEITVDWFHARLRFLFLEFQILRLGQRFDKGVMQCVYAGTFFHR